LPPGRITEQRTRSMALSKKQIALVHVAKNQLGLDETEYREMLRSLYGVSTSKALDNEQLEDLMHRFKAAGFRPAHSSARTSGMHRKPASSRERQLGKVAALLADMSLPWRYADSIAARMYGIPRVRWLEHEQLTAVISALVKKQARDKEQEQKE